VTLCLRNLPAAVETAIRETSQRERISLNNAAIRLLEDSLRRRAENLDFREFYGVWTAAEADAFDAALRAMRQIEPAHPTQRRLDHSHRAGARQSRRGP